MPGLLDELELGLLPPRTHRRLTAKCSVPTDPHGTSRVSTRGSVGREGGGHRRQPRVQFELQSPVSNTGKASILGFKG